MQSGTSAAWAGRRPGAGPGGARQAVESSREQGEPQASAGPKGPVVTSRARGGLEELSGPTSVGGAVPSGAAYRAHRARAEGTWTTERPVMRRWRRPGAAAAVAGHPEDSGAGEHRLGGAAAGEHRAVEGRRVAVVAADEEPALQADRPLDRLERARPLLGLGVVDAVGAQVSPAADLSAEPAFHLLPDRCFEGVGPGVARGASDHAGRDESGPGGRVRRGHLAGEAQVVDGAGPVPVEDEEGLGDRGFLGREVEAGHGARAGRGQGGEARGLGALGRDHDRVAADRLARVEAHLARGDGGDARAEADGAPRGAARPSAPGWPPCPPPGGRRRPRPSSGRRTPASGSRPRASGRAGSRRRRAGRRRRSSRRRSPRRGASRPRTSRDGGRGPRASRGGRAPGSAPCAGDRPESPRRR